MFILFGIVNHLLHPQTTFRAFIQVWLMLEMKNSLCFIKLTMTSETSYIFFLMTACGVLCITMSSEYMKEVLQAIITMYHAQQMICDKNGYEL